MSLSSHTLQALSTELSQQLSGSRLQQIRQSGAEQLSLQFYHQSSQELYLDLNRAHNWLYLSSERPSSQPPDARTMLLRKTLNGQHLQQVQQVDQDRILKLCFEQGHELILELSGRHANLFLLQPIVPPAATALLQLCWRPDNSQRALQVGQAYCPPVPGGQPKSSDPWALESLPPTGARSQKLAQAHRHDRLRQAWREQWHQTERALKQKAKRLQRELTQLHQDLERLDEANAWQRKGELLQGAYGQVERGQSEVAVVDYYSPEQRLCRIALDPKLDLNQNIQRCFQRSRKCERAAERALEILPQQEEALAQVQSVSKKFQTLSPDPYADGAEPKEEALVRLQELYQAWVPQTKSKAPPSGKALPYRSFLSASGQTIRVGKRDRDNDTLSFRLARGRDLWLHVRNYTGSHVVISLQRGETASEQSLLDAATLAVYFSQVRSDSKAEVIYTAVKNLKKPKGAAPGEVQISQMRSLILQVETARLERLLAQNQNPHQNQES